MKPSIVYLLQSQNKQRYKWAEIITLLYTGGMTVSHIVTLHLPINHVTILKLFSCKYMAFYDFPFQADGKKYKHCLSPFSNIAFPSCHFEVPDLILKGHLLILSSVQNVRKSVSFLKKIQCSVVSI